ncbi:MAG: tol-pal system protein YbgF [Gammaproteobacteria bacterium]|nr:tol-pal system protein YbgF [Gammaproteobacteria bacterium]MBU1414454.1 tol-pal system protein YbgF [Gammaproteobacteria bacterium]
MKRAVVVLLAALALPASTVQAGIFDDKEARQRIEKLRVDLDALTDRVERTGRNQIDFVNQSEAIKAELARIRGQLEVLLNEVETTQKRQRDFYVDLDTRLRKLETSPAAPLADARPDNAKVDPAQEGRDYEAAFAAFKSGKYKDAYAAFTAFIKSYPSSGLLPNAHYWAASSQYQLGEFDKAADTFGKVAATWPNDAKAADALLAQGNALSEAGDKKGSRKALESLIAQYPVSSAAQTAKRRLKKK